MERLLHRGVQRHHPAGIIDVPEAVPAADGDRGTQRILEGAAVEGGIDAGLGDGAREIGR